MNKASVIIPVYKVESYLRQCLDSVISQTLKDIEIICIDDGSTDGSSDILREYEGILWEDVDFTTRAVMLANKVAVLKQVLHSYRERSTSIIGRYCGTSQHVNNLLLYLDHAIGESYKITNDSSVIKWLYKMKFCILAYDFSFFEFMNSKKHYISYINACYWKTTEQFIIQGLIKPVSLKIRKKGIVLSFCLPP